MGNVKLYDFATSPNCQRVKIVLEEKKLPYEIVPVDLRKKEQKTPEFLKLNPYGKVPVIVDGDAILCESCIINEYLEDRYPEPALMPKDPARKAQIRLLINYGLDHLNGTYQKLREASMQDERQKDQSLIDNTKKEMKELLQRFEREIGDRPFLAGDFSLLDAALIPRFIRLGSWGILPDPALPRLGNWLQKIKERPSVQVIL